MSHAALCDVRDDERLSGLLAGCRDKDTNGEVQEEEEGGAGTQDEGPPSGAPRRFLTTLVV